MVPVSDVIYGHHFFWMSVDYVAMCPCVSVCDGGRSGARLGKRT